MRLATYALQPHTSSSPLFPDSICNWGYVAGASGAAGPFLRVAAVQLADFADNSIRTAQQELHARTLKIVDAIARGGAAGVQMMVFPEMSLVRYDQRFVQNLTLADMDTAEGAVAASCRIHGVWVVVGGPRFFYDNTTQAKRHWNTALVINEVGDKVYRQAKLHTGLDTQAGRWMGTFQGPGNITASILVSI